MNQGDDLSCSSTALVNLVQGGADFSMMRPAAGSRLVDQFLSERPCPKRHRFELGREMFRSVCARWPYAEAELPWLSTSLNSSSRSARCRREMRPGGSSARRWRSWRGRDALRSSKKSSRPWSTRNCGTATVPIRPRSLPTGPSWPSEMRQGFIQHARERLTSLTRLQPTGSAARPGLAGDPARPRPPGKRSAAHRIRA